METNRTWNTALRDCWWCMTLTWSHWSHMMLKVKTTAKPQASFGPFGYHKQGFHHRLAQNLNDIFQMPIKHNKQMTAFSVSDVMRPERCFLLSQALPRSLAVGVLNFVKFIIVWCHVWELFLFFFSYWRVSIRHIFYAHFQFVQFQGYCKHTETRTYSSLQVHILPDLPLGPEVAPTNILQSPL